MEVSFNPFKIHRQNSATSDNRKLIHWLLMGGLLHLVQQGGDWAGLRGTAVERWSLTGKLSLSRARPAADGRPPMWVNRLL